MSTIDEAGRFSYREAVDRFAGNSLNVMDGRSVVTAGEAKINDETVQEVRDAGDRYSAPGTVVRGSINDVADN